jgi:hypothetical protein
MNKNFLPFLLAANFISLSVFAQQAGENKGWPSAERYSFISSCINTAKSSMSEDSARFYCYCMQEKVEIKYPTIEIAATITEDDMNSPAWQKDIKVCLAGFWSTEERETFLSNCKSSATAGGISEERSKSYCECMLYKVEVRFPNPLDAEKLTPEVLATPEWKKILKGCLEF